MPFLNDLEVSTEEEKIIIHYNYGILEKSPSVQHIEWRKNDKLLNLENEKYIGGNLKAKTFTIISPSNDDRGKYSCTVTNAVGPVTKLVNLGMFIVIAFLTYICIFLTNLLKTFPEKYCWFNFTYKV